MKCKVVSKPFRMARVSGCRLWSIWGPAWGLAWGLVWGLAGAVSLAQAQPVPADRAATADYALDPLVLSPAEQALVDAYAAVQKKQWQRLDELAPLASNAPMVGVYARYWTLRQQLREETRPVPAESAQRFLDQVDDPYLADRIRGEWIVAAVRSGDYSQALQIGPVVNETPSIRCSLLMARHLTGQAVSSEQAMAAFEPVSACWSMLDQFVDRGVVGWEAVRDQLRATLESGKAGHAQRMAALMFDGAQMQAYTALMKNARRWLTGQKAPRTREQRELITLALSRLARGSDRVAAAQYVEQNWAHSLPKQDMQWVWSQFGLVAALNLEPTAAQWYRKSGDAPMTEYNHAWQVRAELRQARIDWAWVERAILKMPATQQAESVWTYWRARSLAARGRDAAARELYQSIRQQFDFYGQLANEELGLPIALPPVPPPVTAAELAQARAHPGLQRAIRLFHLGLRPEAVPAWSFHLRGMDDRQLRAAAELARQAHVYDRVVNTSLLTRTEVDFSQRFIAPFEGRVTRKAREIQLDPAWVYGLIRQESRFIVDARSRVGASGLMQLMPATARWVARKIGMKDYTPASVNDFDTNTVLGTSYLSMVLNDLDGSQLLATAGYNAGPGRPVQWRSKLAAPVEGAIFAETIPFTETRLYVKHVLSNAVYYGLLFNSGQPQSLKRRLGTVSPGAARSVALP